MRTAGRGPDEGTSVLSDRLLDATYSTVLTLSRCVERHKALLSTVSVEHSGVARRLPECSVYGSAVRDDEALAVEDVAQRRSTVLSLESTWAEFALPVLCMRIDSSYLLGAMQRATS